VNRARLRRKRPSLLQRILDGGRVGSATSTILHPISPPPPKERGEFFFTGHWSLTTSH